MASQNPLLLLGIPMDVLASAKEKNDFKIIQKIAKGSYKNLSKFYHPDNPETGDSALMALLTEANEKLSDISNVEIYASELVNENAVARQREVQMNKDLQAVAQSTALANLVAVSKLMTIVSQYSLVGVKSPTSFLCFENGVVSVVNMLDHRVTTVEVFNDTGIVDFSSHEFRFYKGKWQFKVNESLAEINNLAEADALAGMADFGMLDDDLDPKYKVKKLKNNSKLGVKWNNLTPHSEVQNSYFTVDCRAVGLHLKTVSKTKKSNPKQNVQALEGAKFSFNFLWKPLANADFLSDITFAPILKTPIEKLSNYEVRIVFRRGLIIKEGNKEVDRDSEYALSLPVYASSEIVQS